VDGPADALPKDATQPAQVDAAKADATSKGADDVGALDSDEYPSLDPGEYVVYSGTYSSKKAARKDLRALRKDFPDAKVVEVAASSDGGGGGSTKGRQGRRQGLGLRAQGAAERHGRRLRQEVQEAQGQGRHRGQGAQDRQQEARRRRRRRDGAGVSVEDPELDARRQRLATEVAERQWDLGGLAYEMAIRDHFRLDVLVRAAARMQEADAS
jgi:hypothetical protein